MINYVNEVCEDGRFKIIQRKSAVSSIEGKLLKSWYGIIDHIID